MSQLELWLVLIALGGLTFAIRVSFIELIGRRRISPQFTAMLKFVPPAVLSAIVLPELLLTDGALNISLANARLLAGLIAAAVAWRTKNVLLTIGVGMLALWVLLALAS